ncbi:AraC family transcriptional regulator [Flavobacterium tegetincola]|uniref:AraC family transcriptional regulator n=1 Tax=Flavobacterium tegetincola TaxID=150172 RepID=UPI000400460C|nr:AraC family transcriptional regulator [Flavobacterium tegetincola]
MIHQHDKLHLPALTTEKSLKTLVENRSVYSLNHCELNIFETYEKSELVPLQFNDLVVTSMMRGKKIMHLYDDPAFEYLPGETLVIPANVKMKIDFPEASKEHPTQCIALAIDRNKITETLQFLNERYPKVGENQMWELDFHNYFFYNNIDLATTINKLMRECMSTSITKDVLADLTLQELLVRIIQTQTIKELDNPNLTVSKNKPINYITEYIQKNLKEDVSLKKLSSITSMSTTSFYRFFKRELGMSPLEFILNEKLKCAKKLLKNPSIQINEVCYLSGFENANYFSRLFKKHEGMTPKQYQLLLVN